jgi:hypothetical protein
MKRDLLVRLCHHNLFHLCYHYPLCYECKLYRMNAHMVQLCPKTGYEQLSCLIFACTTVPGRCSIPSQPVQQYFCSRQVSLFLLTAAIFYHLCTLGIGIRLQTDLYLCMHIATALRDTKVACLHPFFYLSYCSQTSNIIFAPLCSSLTICFCVIILCK